jgi:FKBP-type peptidyl-prolyl cis-trans isomerase (trigger factor)
VIFFWGFTKSSGREQDRTSRKLLESGNLDKKPRFTFTVPLAHKVELGDYRSIRLPYDWKEPGKEKADDALEELRRMYAKTETVDRPVEVGDFVLIDLKGINTKAGEGAAPEIDRPGMPVFIQTKIILRIPFSRISKELIGLRRNEESHHKYEKDHKDDVLRKNDFIREKVKMVCADSA